MVKHVSIPNRDGVRPCGASAVGRRYSTALTNLEPDRRTEAGENDEGEALNQDIAVESRDADKTRLFVGDTTARTWNHRQEF